MTEMSHTIDLELPKKLQDPEYRQAFFWAETGAEIAHGLVSLRKRRNMSQKDVAKATGTQQPAISRAEKADYDNWNLRTLRSIADALGARIRIVIQPYEDVLSEYKSENTKSNTDEKTLASNAQAFHIVSESAVQGYIISVGGDGNVVNVSNRPNYVTEKDVTRTSQSSPISLQSQNAPSLISYAKVSQSKQFIGELASHQ